MFSCSKRQELYSVILSHTHRYAGHHNFKKYFNVENDSFTGVMNTYFRWRPGSPWLWSPTCRFWQPYPKLHVTWILPSWQILQMVVCLIIKVGSKYYSSHCHFFNIWKCLKQRKYCQTKGDERDLPSMYTHGVRWNRTMSCGI